MFTKSVKGRLSTLVVGCIAAAMAASGQTNAGALQKAAVLARQHRFKEAMAEMKGVAPPVETAQRIAYFRLRAAVASGMGDASGAAEAMEEGLRLAPGDSSLRLATAAAQAALGDVSEKRGRSLQAVRAFQRAVKLAPEVEDFRLALAVELLQHQTFAPAIATLEEATKQFPESPRIRRGSRLSLLLRRSRCRCGANSVIGIRLRAGTSLLSGNRTASERRTRPRCGAASLRRVRSSKRSAADWNSARPWTLATIAGGSKSFKG